MLTLHLVRIFLDTIEYQYYYSGYYHAESDIPYYAYFYGSGCSTPLLMLVFIPAYLYLLRPLIYGYILGMLKLIGLGMLLCLISGFCTLVMGVPNCNCISKSCSSYFNISPHFLLMQYGLKLMLSAICLSTLLLMSSYAPRALS